LTELEQKLCTPNEATTIWYGQKTLNVFGKIHYLWIVIRAYYKLYLFYWKALRTKECYYGPFKGEFGHFLLHNLPFLSRLHARGVKINYCGMQLHEAFLVDHKGQSIIYQFYPLRDFFAEVPSCANETIPPADVQNEIDKFYAIAIQSKKAFLDIADKDMYWFRNWQLKPQRQYRYDISKVYQTKEENACVIFPRKKGNAFTPNNGGPWDYLDIARRVSLYFDKVYITGHPSMSAELESEGNIEVCLSTDNKVIIEKCSNAQLIISQHSGAIHLGAYTNSNVVLIFNGTPPIKGLIDTLRFRKNVSTAAINYAFSMDDLIQYVNSLSLKNIKPV
jgi:hypothetical protein